MPRYTNSDPSKPRTRAQRRRRRRAESKRTAELLERRKRVARPKQVDQTERGEDAWRRVIESP